MNNHHERAETDSSCDVEITEVYRGLDVLFEKAAQAIRDPLKETGLEPLEDNQRLVSELVIVPNESPEKTPYIFTEEHTGVLFIPKTLKVGFVLNETVAHPTRHVFRKWLASKMPYVDKDKLLHDSPKEYLSLQVTIWPGEEGISTGRLETLFLGKDGVASLLGDPTLNKPRLEKMQENIKKTEHLLDTCVTEVQKISDI
jgi:hypothetical protein